MCLPTMDTLSVQDSNNNDDTPRRLSTLMDISYLYITSLETGIQFRLEKTQVLNGHGYASLYLR